MAVGHWNESVLDLIPEYRATRRMLTIAREKTTDKADRERLGEMIRDTTYVLEWLETGRNPMQRKGVERRYERPWQAEWMDRYMTIAHEDIDADVNTGMTEDMRQKVEDAMRNLSPRERECFIMHIVDGWSYGRIARELHLSKGTVQICIERAREKIAVAKENLVLR